MATLKEAAAILDVHPTWLCNQLRGGLLEVSSQKVSPCGKTDWQLTPEDIVELHDSTLLKAERLRKEWRRVYNQAIQEAKERRGKGEQRPVPPGQYYRPGSR